MLYPACRTMFFGLLAFLALGAVSGAADVAKKDDHVGPVAGSPPSLVVGVGQV